MKPKFVLIVSIILFHKSSLLLAAPSKITNPNILNDALSAIGACVHWGGEVGDQSEERNQEIADGLSRDCPEAQKKARTALDLYPNDPQLAEAIIGLSDFGYFDLSPIEKKRVCESAAPIFKKWFKESKQPNNYVRGQCPEQALLLYGAPSAVKSVPQKKAIPTTVSPGIQRLGYVYMDLDGKPGAERAIEIRADNTWALVESSKGSGLFDIKVASGRIGSQGQFEKLPSDAYSNAKAVWRAGTVTTQYNGKPIPTLQEVQDSGVWK